MALLRVKQTLRKPLERLAARAGRHVPGRALVRGHLLARLRERARAFDDAELGASALVVAPHPDDETLGCGGTVARKRAHGAEVHVLVLTDGTGSHAHFMERPSLRAVRAAEFAAACGELGVPETQRHHFDLPDGDLHAHLDEAARRLGALLPRLSPAQIFIPHPADPPRDHQQVHQIVTRALAHTGLSAAVFGYPVWLWRHWPFTGFAGDDGESHEVLVDSWRLGFGARVLQDFTRVVELGEALGQKARALVKYQSQMTRLGGRADWPTLQDVSGGEFFQNFLLPFECFAEVVA